MTQIAVGYGRKSFDDPDRRTSSVEDQRVAASAYAASHGFAFEAFHGDNGISGATMERPGLQCILKALVEGGVKILIIEDVDRLSRDQEHIHYMAKVFRNYGVTLHTVATGPIDDLVLTFKGLIGEQQRMRIAYTTRRGLKGKAQRGGVTGGRTLGYRREIVGHDASGCEIDRLAIDPKQAELVVRIFELYAEGNSLKRVCAILNAEGIPSPRARETGPYSAGIWNPTTLSGDPSMGEGILNNATYVGKMIFNRRKWIEIPNENRGFSRRPRLNPESEWVVRDAPQLRIVRQQLWDAVKDRQVVQRSVRDERFKLTGQSLAGGRENTHLLSGLVECGQCGRPFLACGGGRWRCKGNRSDQCTNGSIAAAMLEDRALVGVRDKLLAPERIDRFAGMLEEELINAWREKYSERAAQEARLVAVQAAISKIVRQVENEGDVPRSLTKRLLELESEEGAIELQLAEASPEPFIRPPANYASMYRSAVENLGGQLSGNDALAARTKLRKLITKVVVGGGDVRGGKKRPMQLHGDIYDVLEFASASTAGVDKQKARRSRDGLVVTGMVAGTGFEPVTFRL